MRRLIALVVILATLYGAYWFVGRSQIQTRLSEALVEIDAGDFDLSYATLHTRGFPSRFDTTITDLAFDDPVGRVSYLAPTFQLFALSYRPNEVIAVFPAQQTLTLDEQVYEILSDDMRASGKVRASGSLTFQTATLQADRLRIRSSAGLELATDSLLAAMRLIPESTQSYDVFFEAKTIDLPENVRTMLDPQNLQPDWIEGLRFDSDLELSAPIELNGDPAITPDITNIAITELTVTWGEISATVIGDVRPDAAGVLDGSFTVTARNWQRAVDLAVTSGTLPEDRRLLVTGVLNNLDDTPDFPDMLTLTLSITDGQMMLGAVPLGPAPVLR